MVRKYIRPAQCNTVQYGAVVDVVGAYLDVCDLSELGEGVGEALVGGGPRESAHEAAVLAGQDSAAQADQGRHGGRSLGRSVARRRGEERRGEARREERK